MELSVHWFLLNVQKILAPVDTGADCSLIFGNADGSPDQQSALTATGEDC